MEDGMATALPTPDFWRWFGHLPQPESPVVWRLILRYLLARGSRYPIGYWYPAPGLVYIP